MISSYLNGVREGESTLYHPNGIIYSQGMYKNGVKDGRWQFFNNENNLDTTITYINE